MSEKLDAHEIAYYAVRGTDRDPVNAVAEVEKMIEDFAKAKAGQHETIVMWRPVEEEEPPKDGTKILGARYNHTFGNWDISVIKWNGDTWKVVPTRDYRMSLLPSHWKPITEPQTT